MWSGGGGGTFVPRVGVAGRDGGLGVGVTAVPTRAGVERPDLDERNPVGTGYCVRRGDVDEMPLPNLESPRERRCPLPPEDFDPRFHSVASPGLASAEPLRGELDVVLVHVARRPVLRFRLPGSACAWRSTSGASGRCSGGSCGR